jgi:hypothetical protein
VIFAFPHKGIEIAYFPEPPGTVAATRMRFPRPTTVHGVGAAVDVHGVPPESSQNGDDHVVPLSVEDAILIWISVPEKPFWDWRARVAASD